ncbi:MAG: cytochrome C biogenesis protein CcdA [Rhodospirillaceae bacterium]|nr:cytochrome C biogenesis protein CcdA [Rhodospirillaceae bacterium]
MELMFGYIAGLLTLINPCVLPVLPLILSSVIRREPLGPVALCGGLSLSFVLLGVSVAALGPLIGLNSDDVARTGAITMIGFGLIIMVPELSARFASATSRLSNYADKLADGTMSGGISGHFISGILLGAAWSPCIGPTLGGAISLAAQGQSIAWAGAIMTSFALGTSTIILLLAYGARDMINRRQVKFRKFAEHSKAITAALLISVGLAILLGLHKLVEVWFIKSVPLWFQDLSVTF